MRLRKLPVFIAFSKDRWRTRWYGRWYRVYGKGALRAQLYEKDADKILPQSGLTWKDGTTLLINKDTNGSWFDELPDELSRGDPKTFVNGAMRSPSEFIHFHDSSKQSTHLLHYFFQHQTKLYVNWTTQYKSKIITIGFLGMRSLDRPHRWTLSIKTNFNYF